MHIFFYTLFQMTHVYHIYIMFENFVYISLHHEL